MPLQTEVFFVNMCVERLLIRFLARYIVSYLPVCGRRILLIYPIISSERYSKAVDVHPTAYLTMPAGMRSLFPSKQKYLCDLWCVYKLVSSYILHTVRRVPTPRDVLADARSLLMSFLFFSFFESMTTGKNICCVLTSFGMIISLRHQKSDLATPSTS